LGRQGHAKNLLQLLFFSRYVLSKRKKDGSSAGNEMRNRHLDQEKEIENGDGRRGDSEDKNSWEAKGEGMTQPL